MAAVPAIPDDQIATALLDVASGQKISQVAERLGVHHNTLRLWLMRRQPEKYKELQEIGLISRVLECDEALDKSDSFFTLSKADRAAKHARWDVEHRLQHLFSTRSEVTGADGAPLIQDAGELARRLAFLKDLDGRQVVDLEPISDNPAETEAQGIDSEADASPNTVLEPTPPGSNPEDGEGGNGPTPEVS